MASALLLPIFAAQAKHRILTSSYYLQNIPPQLFFDLDNRPISGILFDITHAIAAEIDAKIEMLPIPRKRLEQALVSDLVDMNCVANPNWYSSNKLRWSEPIYHNPDVLINRLNIKSLEQFEAKKSLTLGLTLGYVYPELESKTQSPSTKVIRNLSAEQSYLAYRKGKSDAFVSAKAEAAFFNLTPFDSIVPLNNNNIHCVFSPAVTEHEFKKLTKAIRKLKGNGTFSAILAKYNFNQITG